MAKKACYNTQANWQHLACGTINWVTTYLLGSVAQHLVPQLCWSCSSSPCPRPRAVQPPWHWDSHLERLVLTSQSPLGWVGNRSWRALILPSVSKQVTNTMITSSGQSIIVRAFYLLLIFKGVLSVCYYENVWLPHLEGSTEELIVINTGKEDSWMSFK